MAPETSDFLLYLELLVLLGVANGAPLFGRMLLGDRFGRPLDAGARFVDGRPLFGRSKTLRGLLLSLVTTPVAAELLGLGGGTGLVAAALAMLGDLSSSFTKRRLGLAPSSRALGLDQIPESLFPLLALSGQYALAAGEIALMVAVFVALELAISRLLYKLRLRDQPY